jgi:adenine-specific DNA-methyltransferase
MSQNYEKLKAKLLELFMLDQPELDFGIYRIMNSKRTEIAQFLEKDLLPQVKSAFAQYTSVDKGHIESELAKAVEQAKQLGVDPEATQKVKDIRAKLAESVDLTALENEVYSDLYNFFRRYYKDGDFLSLRRYKEGVYAIPYEGEEVKLYWANHDQYYIKSSEYLRDYAFNLPNGKKVHFKLTEADIEKDNTKADVNKERLFVPADENFIAEENGELIIRFLYISCEKGTSQRDLIAKAMEKIFQSNGVDSWLASLSAKAPTDKNPNRTLLEKHLTCSVEKLFDK